MNLRSKLATRVVNARFRNPYPGRAPGRLVVDLVILAWVTYWSFSLRGGAEITLGVLAIGFVVRQGVLDLIGPLARLDFEGRLRSLPVDAYLRLTTGQLPAENQDAA